MKEYRNAVDKAVYAIGGATKAGHIFGISGTAVHAWIRNGKISDIDKARKLSELSGVPLTDLRPV